MTGKVLLLASAKGGVGKSTVALGVSRALTRREQRVLLVDLDFHNPCLDLLCGVEDRVIYTLADAVAGICATADACIGADTDGRLYLLPAGNVGDAPAPEAVETVIRAAAEELEVDWVILDTGAGKSAGLLAAIRLARTAVIVAGHAPMSIRAAERTGEALEAQGISDLRLVINSFDCAGALGQRSSMLQIMDGARLPLLGVVPYDYELILEEEGHGTAAGGAATAFGNIAARLLLQNVPLFSGIWELRRKRKRLFR